jgi:hypothetical protein
MRTDRIKNHFEDEAKEFDTRMRISPLWVALLFYGDVYIHLRIWIIKANVSLVI